MYIKREKKGFGDLIECNKAVSQEIEYRRQSRKIRTSHATPTTSNKTRSSKNPLIAAIDKIVIPNAIYSLRAPIKVSRSYKAKLTDIESIGIRLRQISHRQDQLDSDRERARLRLTFESEKTIVAVEESKASDESQNVFNSDYALLSIESIHAQLPLPYFRSRKASNKPRSRINSIMSFHSDNSTSQEGFKLSEGRNVPYMLQIWEKAEGIHISDIIPPSRFEQIHSDGRSEIGTRNQRSRNTTISSSELPALTFAKSSKSYEAIASNIELNPVVERSEKSESQDSANTISNSTLKFLKRMSRENPSDEADSAYELALIQKTLVGDFNLESKETLSHSANQSKRIPKLESPFRNMTPGTCSKTIGAFISDDGDLISAGIDRKKVTDSDFRLFIPAISKPGEDDPIHPRPQSKEFQSADSAQRLRATFGKGFASPAMSAKAVRPQSEILVVKLSSQGILAKKTIAHESDFAMKRFVSKLKLLSSSEKTLSVEELGFCSAFIEQFAIKQTNIPGMQLKEREEFLKCLLLSLRKDSDKESKFEAIMLIILIEGDVALNRWDAMMFKKGLNEIMETGSNDQKHIVCLFYVRNGQLDFKVVQQIRLGLGDLEEKKRSKCVEILCGLDSSFAKTIISILIEDSDHTNWRIRFDVVRILKTWIPRLSPPEKAAPPSRDPDALDTDDDATVRALFITLGTSYANPIPDGAAVKPLEASAFKDSKPVDRIITLYFASIQVLLKLMTNDWSIEVRTAASEAVGLLRLGKPMFKWIISALESQDPIKRMDALRCLTCIQVVDVESLPALVKCFKDPYSIVKIEACKVAKSLKSCDKLIISALLDLLDDHEYKVRAHAVKGIDLILHLALGVSKSKASKLRESLNWSLQHDSSSAVRAEAVQAVYALGLILDDQLIKDGVLSLFTSDKSERVRKEAERVLVLSGLIFLAPAGSEDVKTTIDGKEIMAFPQILGDQSAEEIKIYLKESLIGDDSMSAVINNVKKLASKGTVITQVENDDSAISNRLDLQYDSPFIPQTQSIHNSKKKHSTSLEFGII